MNQKQTLSMIHRFEPGENLREVIERGGDLFIVTDRGVYLVETVRIIGEGPSLNPPDHETAAPEPPPVPRKPKLPDAPKAARKAEAPPTARRESEIRPAPSPQEEERARAVALRSAKRQGWQELRPGRRPPRGAERGLVHGVQMWRQK